MTGTLMKILHATFDNCYEVKLIIAFTYFVGLQRRKIFTRLHKFKISGERATYNMRKV